MTKYKVTQEHDNCISCGACVAACPDNWEMGEDGKAKPKSEMVDDVGCNQAAADACPVSIIHVEEVQE